MVFMCMHNPPHPGEVLKEMLIENYGLSVHDAAKNLGIPHQAFIKLLDCRNGLNPEMAVRLSIALCTSSHFWLNLQSTFDLHQAEKSRNQISKEVIKILHLP